MANMRRAGWRMFTDTVRRSAARLPEDWISLMLPAVTSGRTPSMGALTLIDRSEPEPRVHM